MAYSFTVMITEARRKKILRVLREMNQDNSARAKKRMAELSKKGMLQEFYIDGVECGQFSDDEVSQLLSESRKEKAASMTVEENKKAVFEKVGLDENGRSRGKQKIEIGEALRRTQASKKVTLAPPKQEQQEQLELAKPVKQVKKTKKSDKQLVSFYIEEDLLNRLKELAQEEDRSYSSLIRIACRKYLGD